MYSLYKYCIHHCPHVPVTRVRVVKMPRSPAIRSSDPVQGGSY